MSMNWIDPKLRQISTEQLEDLQRQTEALLVPQPRTQDSVTAYDPLTGNESVAPPMASKVEQLLTVMAQLVNDVMLAQAFQVPNQILTLQFDGDIPAVGYREVHFTIQGKNVSATTIYLQNNTPNPIYYDLDGVPAGPNSIELAALSSSSIYSILVSSLTFYAGADVPINQQGGLMIRAFGSSELTRQRGQR